jgi:phosphopantetheinyl transferase
MLAAVVPQAFIKARGDGIAFELSQIQVSLPQASSQDWARQPVQPAGLTVVGQQQESGNWRAFLQQLPNQHWVAVVRGPPAAAVDANGVSEPWGVGSTGRCTTFSH